MASPEFFLASGPCQCGEKSREKNIIFRYNNGYKQRLGPLVAKQRQSSGLFSWARVLNEAEKEENNGKAHGKSGEHSRS